ncbi:MAG TPA: hypothetical protein VFU00_07460 [Gemmatimonadales bacterium]|nr:hypothetical protein [Gemmatimonadales bacterium]
MSGHVFHPGHEELHGVTVVIRGVSGRTYVGRYHERGDRGVVLHDVGVHEPGSGISRDDWLARIRKFGIKVDHRTLIVPQDEAGEVERLAS